MSTFKMKRYSLYNNQKGRAWIEESDDGDYVLADDAHREMDRRAMVWSENEMDTLKRRDSRIAELEAAIDKLMVNNEFKVGLRDEFAKAALIAIGSKYDFPMNAAKDAYILADAMLEARNANL